ncbi:hypothetical protein [Haloferula sargassicola]|uniref:Polysaccharide chain length determinant N-terminal domain-containing protein n=1 Tax=Haloferula sargassicola TaxID=490096 RepID=A0ABP9UND4_9BACT
MMKRYWWVIPVLAVVGGSIGLLAAGVVTYVMPKMYESRSVLQVRPVPIGGVAGSVNMATEFEIIDSVEILDEVARRLDLANHWNLTADEVRELLRDRIEPSHIKGTDLVEIKVRASNPQDARAVAAAVSEAYRTWKMSLAKQRVDGRLDEMRAALEAQEKIVEEKRRALDREGGDSGLVRPLRKSFDPPQAGLDAAQEFEAAQEELERLKIEQIGKQMQKRISEDPVIVHEEPVESTVPVSPNVALNLVIGTVAGMVGGATLGVLMSLLLDKRRGVA